jgi:succinoglycan biosynthesis transport protein ExoP
MLQVGNRTVLSQHAGGGEASSSESLQRFLQIAKRQYPVILVAFFAAFGLAALYLATTPPDYTATATMVIDTSKLNVFQNQSIMNEAVVDSTTVETQVEVLKSENIALSIIKELHLTEDPEFVKPSGGLIGTILNLALGMFSSPHTPSDFELTRKALNQLQSRETIRRNGMTYVIDIGFRSLNPERAAQIANAIADAYVVDQLEAKFQSTKRAGIWLQDRIAEIRTQAATAEKAVQTYKQQNNIVDAGGRLMSDQQLAEVNSQLVLARAQTAEAKARLDRIEAIVHGGVDVPDAGVTDALHNEVITKLRSQYLEHANREAEWSARYGKDHLAALSLRNSMAEIRKSIFDELGRIAESYKSDYKIAQAREDSIKQSMEQVVSDSQATNQAQLGLRELEANAQTYRTIYDTFLQRYMEAIQQQSFPITESRVISPATRPLKPSHPNLLIVLTIAGFGGLLLSAGGALFRESYDQVFRTSSQVERLLQTTCLAVLPKLSHSRVRGRKLIAAGPGQRVLTAEHDLLSYAIDTPLSRFSESLRAIKVAVDLNSDEPVRRVIGITSTLPKEGKSTIAVNFSRLMAHAGLRVVLIDGDLRNPSLSRELTPGIANGLIEVLSGRTPLDDAIWTDSLTSLSFLPMAKASVVHTSEILASDAMKALVESLRSSYEYVIIDLPPLAPVVDVRATTAFIGSYVYVVEWGMTKTDVVEHHLGRADAVHDRLLGAVLNKANAKALNRYESYYGSAHYNKYYARYGYSEG